MKDNIRIIPGGNTPNVSKVSLTKLREDIPIIIEYMGIRSKLLMENFKTLKAEGFTDEQALILCKEGL